MNGLGIIKFEIEGLSPSEVVRWRDSLHKIIASGALNCAGGEVALHFDKDAELQQINFNYVKYRRAKKEGEDDVLRTVDKPLTIKSS